MPSRDPATGKRLPGSKQRKRTAEREAPDPRQSASIAAAAVPQGAETDGQLAASEEPRAPTPTAAGEPEWLGRTLPDNPFVQLDPPPIEDTAQLVRWAARLHALALKHISLHPEIYPNQREWLRALLGGTTQLGIIRDKAAEQQKIDEALRRDEEKGKKVGLTDVRGRKAQEISRPTGGAGRSGV